MVHQDTGFSLVWGSLEMQILFFLCNQLFYGNLIVYTYISKILAKLNDIKLNVNVSYRLFIGNEYIFDLFWFQLA